MLKVKTAVDVRQEWTAALRSGKITQITGSATNKMGGMCVWGVLLNQLGIDYDDMSGGGPWVKSAARAGITQAQQQCLITGNNAGVPFSILADEIDALPYTS